VAHGHPVHCGRRLLSNQALPQQQLPLCAGLQLVKLPWMQWATWEQLNATACKHKRRVGANGTNLRADGGGCVVLGHGQFPWALRSAQPGDDNQELGSRDPRRLPDAGAPHAVFSFGNSVRFARLRTPDEAMLPVRSSFPTLRPWSMAVAHRAPLCSSRDSQRPRISGELRNMRTTSLISLIGPYG